RFSRDWSSDVCSSDLPGSTIGNFEPERAVRLLRRFHSWAGPGGGLLIGVDTRKDPAVLNLAYNDRQGVTAAFNLNILNHVNRLKIGRASCRERAESMV